MDNTNVKTNQRKENKDSSSVDEEVNKLFKHSNGKLNQHEFQKLRNKFGNEEFVNKIERVFISTI